MTLSDKQYLHLLVKSGLVNRKFLWHVAAKGSSWENVYTYISKGIFPKEFPKMHWKNIQRNLSKYDKDKLWKFLEENEVSFLVGDEIPQLLTEIPDPPFFLYSRGDLASCLSQRGFSVVGARNIQPYAIKTTEKIVQIIVSGGYTVISGLALGVDGLSHDVCLKNQGKTIAVLGNGITEAYPSSHFRLYKQILEKGGAIISEYPPGFQATRYSFPERNRIIAGLCEDICIIQARDKSGSLITASYALDQGKNIYVLPGQIDDDNFFGSNKLLSQGAYLISNVEDFAETIGGKVDQKIPHFDTQAEKDIWDILYSPQTLDSIMHTTKLSSQEINNILLKWELESVIVKRAGKYERK